jgi:hypothetical protein
MIEILKEVDKKEFFYFLNSYWKKDHIFVKSELLFDYQHKSSDGYNFLINKNEKIITSILGFIPSDNEGKHLWLAIWKSKSKGMEGISLLFQLLKRKPIFIGVLGISVIASKIYKGLGWESGILSHYYLSINPKINLRRYTSNKIDSDFLFSSEFKFYQNQDWCLPKKDNHYYKKRYLEHPFFKYYFLSILNNEITFIGRIIEYNLLKVFHVVDVLGDLNGKKISQPILCFLKKEGFDLFEMMTFDSRRVTTDLLMKNNSEIIPTYLSPFENRNIQIELCYKKSNDLPVRFFLGDSDQDRPN